MQRYPQRSIGHPGQTLLIWLAVMFLAGAAIALFPRIRLDPTFRSSDEVITIAVESFLALLIVMWLVFRCWQGVAATLLVVMSSISVSYGAMSILGVTVTMPLGAVMVFLTALGMQYSTYVGLAHRARVHRERSHARPPPRDHRFIASEAMRDVRGPVVLSAILSAIGFGSMYLTRVPDARLMGVFLVIGLATTSIGVMTIFPAVIALFPFEVPDPRPPDRLQRAIVRAGSVSTSRPWLMLAIFAGVLAIGIFGVTRLDDDTDAVHLAGSMLKSLGVATLLIWLIACISLDSFKLGTLSLIPTLAPCIIVYALLPLLGQPLEPPGAMVAAVALGILSGRAILFIKAWLWHCRRGNADTVSAIAAALSEVGKPMILSSVVVMIGFSILVLSRQGTLVRTGILMCLVISTAVLWELLCSPALLRLAGKRPPRSIVEDTPRIRDFQKVVADDQRTSFADYTDQEIANMTTMDFLALAGKTVIRQGGSSGTRRLLVELDIQPNHWILEVGAGVGTTAFDLIANEPTLHVRGVDLSSFMVEQARQRAKEMGLSEHISFIHTRDPYAMPFDDNTFDVIMVESVAMYNDPKRFFHELFRVLKPGGKLGLHDWCWIEKPSADLEVMTCVVACGCKPGDVRFFTQDDWEQSLIRQGFEIQFAEEYPFIFFSLGGMRDDEGALGVVKIFGRVLSRMATARRMFSMMMFLARHESMYGYTITVARKPPVAAVAAGA